MQIVQFYGAVIESDSLLLIMELMARGSLYDVLAQDNEGQYSWYKRQASPFALNLSSQDAISLFQFKHAHVQG